MNELTLKLEEENRGLKIKIKLTENELTELKDKNIQIEYMNNKLLDNINF